MKKAFALACMSLLALTCTTTSCNKKTYLTQKEAKEIASDELGAFEFELEDFTECELFEIKGLENKVYRLGASDGLVGFHDVIIDGVTGDVYQYESESLYCGKYEGYEDKGHLSLDEVEQIIFNYLPGTNDFNIATCYFDIDDDKENKPFYYATIFTIEDTHDLIIDAITGEILEDDLKENDTTSADLKEFKEEFHDYLPENRFKDANGQRPVWLLAHHCNDDYYKSGKRKPDYKRDVYKGIKSGCNGVEIDLSHRMSDASIILRHSPEIVAHAETLWQFLELPEMSDPQMTMVLYDIKDYDFIVNMVQTTHNFYKENPANQKVHFIYSTSKLSNLKNKGDPYFFFREVKDKLWPNEALAIDYENNQDAVQTMFNDLRFERGVFGNGIFNGRARGNIENSCKAAVAIRDNPIASPDDKYRFKAVNSWTVGRLYNKNVFFFESVGLKERIDWGCDIVLLDGFKRLKESTFNTFYGRELFNLNKNVRLATRDDYPFGIKPKI